MIPPHKLLYLLLLLREYLNHVRCSLHVVDGSVGSDERKVMLRAEYLLVIISAEDPFAVVYLPLTTIQTDAIGSTVAEHIGIAQTVLRVVDITVTVHLEPIHMLLLGHAEELATRGKHHQPLIKLVIAELYIVVHHTIIAHTASIGVCIILIVWAVVPQPFLILSLYGSNIQAGIVGGRGDKLLSPGTMYYCRHTDDYQQVFLHVLLNIIRLIRYFDAKLSKITQIRANTCMKLCNFNKNTHFPHLFLLLTGKSCL